MVTEVKADLHVHTTASDGTWTPEELVENIKKAGIRLFAVTDHDTTGSVAQAEKLAAANGLSFVRGVEVSASFNEKQYHILALGINPSDAQLMDLLDENRTSMADNNKAGIRYLEEKYPRISYEEFLQYQYNPERGGWKSLNYLIDKGVCTSISSFFAVLKDWKGPSSKVKFRSPDQVIKTILQAGGVPILAHPGSTMYGHNLEETLSIMLEAGIKGLECFHPENSDEATRRCLAFCEEHNLCITGGSDCHGQFVGTRRLGHPPVSLSQLRLDGIEIQNFG